MLVSAIQQHEPAVCINISPPSWEPLSQPTLFFCLFVCCKFLFYQLWVQRYFPCFRMKLFFTFRQTIFLNLFFNWRKIALQCCVDFCHTMQVSHNCAYIPLSWAFLSSPHLTPLGLHRAPGLAPCVIQQLLTSYLFYTW